MNTYWKKKYMVAILFLAMTLPLSSCFDDSIEPPALQGFEYGVMGENGSFVPVSQAPLGEEIIFQANSDAELLVIWTGERETIKASDGSDSLDFDTGLPLLNYSHHWDDYGIYKAQGIPFQIIEDDTYNFRATYTFKQPGPHQLKVVATKHGYNDTNYQNTYHDFTIEVVE